MTASKERDPFWHHLATLEAKRSGAQPPPVYDGKPECGYFRRKVADGSYVAAAIWWNAKPGQAPELVCRVGSEMRDPVSEWTWLASHNVEESEALHFFRTGRWRDGAAEAAGAGGEPAPSSGPGGADTAPSADGAVGYNHNQPPEEPADADEAALAKLLELIESARDWLKGIKNKLSGEQEAQIATNKVGELRAAYGRVKKIHRARKEKINEAGRAIDKKWLHPSQDGEKASAHLLKLIADYTDAKNAEIERQRRKAEEAQRKAEEAHARKAAAAEKKGKPPPPPPPPPPAPPAPITKIESMTGRAISVGTRPELYVKDRKELLEAYRDDERLYGALEVLARSDWKQTGQLPPGCGLKQVPKAA